MFVSPPLMVRVLIMGKTPEKMEDRLGKIPGKNHSDKIDFRSGNLLVLKGPSTWKFFIKK